VVDARPVHGEDEAREGTSNEDASLEVHLDNTLTQRSFSRWNGRREEEEHGCGCREAKG
jgi:hypothetical protein